MSVKRVLIVDDDPLSFEFTAATLPDSIKIIFVSNGEDALSIAHSQKPDLILLDLVMPGMNGYEICQRLKSNPETASIPVIFISGVGDVPNQTRGLELGAVDYITKPFNPDIVRAKVKNQLDRIEKPQRHIPKTTTPNRRGAVVAGLLVLIGAVSFLGFHYYNQGTNSKSQETVSQTGSLSTPATSLEWVSNSRCEALPQVNWWKYNTHRSIAVYVRARHNGVWNGYRQKWITRLGNLEDIYSRNSAASTATGITLEGDSLKKYIANVKKRILIIECLSQESSRNVTR